MMYNLVIFIRSDIWNPFRHCNFYPSQIFNYANENEFYVQE